MPVSFCLFNHLCIETSSPFSATCFLFLSLVISLHNNVFVVVVFCPHRLSSVTVTTTGIPIDLVGGTSIGSFVGALYAEETVSCINPS